MVAEIFDALETVRRAGTTSVLVEQNVTAALPMADRIAVMERGRIVSVGSAADFARDARFTAKYLGARVTAAGAGGVVSSSGGGTI